MHDDDSLRPTVIAEDSPQDRRSSRSWVPVVLACGLVAATGTTAVEWRVQPPPDAEYCAPGPSSVSEK